MEFWLFIALNALISLPLKLIADPVGIGLIPYDVFGYAIIIPSLAVAVRRLRDGGNSPWLIIFLLLPLIGTVVLIVLWLQRSQEPTAQRGVGSTSHSPTT
ncbi:DUF805 domain-containing protein [Streptomyces sp. SID14478]|nr:DUF805 domain-containing protein [Streptomyces sp. SID14478]